MNDDQPMTEEVRLESWKEIAEYLQRNTTTARRWEREEGLPVHRHSHKSRSSVYAYRSEIDAWRVGRTSTSDAGPGIPAYRWPAFALTLALCLVMVGNGARPVSAQAPAPTARLVWTPGDQYDPSLSAPSADGVNIGFIDWSTGDLGVRDLISGTNRRLTNTAEESGEYAERSVVSPDGRMVAYSWVAGGGDLRIVPSAGGTTRTLYRAKDKGGYMAPYGWTPDGKEILARLQLPDRTWQITMVSVSDGSVRVIKSLGWGGSDPRLSPDGRFITYDRPVDDKMSARDIFVLATDGSSETTLVENPANDTAPLWSPDGAQVVFVSDRTGPASLWATPVRNGKPAGPAKMLRADFADKRPLGITRSGVLYYVAQIRKDANVYVTDLDPAVKVTQAPRVTTGRFMNANQGSSISPDGQRLAYYSGRLGQGLVIVTRDLKSGEEKDTVAQQPIDSTFFYGPLWFPDNRSVLVVNRDTQRPGFTFLRVNIADGTTQPLLQTGRLQGWALSPDGKSVYYTETDSNSEKTVTRLVRFNFETKQQTVLKQGSWVISVSVSPDSQQVAYLVNGGGSLLANGQPDRGAQIEVMPVTGGVSRMLYRASPWDGGSRYNGLGWTPDQKYLLFAKEEGPGTTLWRIPAAGGEAEHVGVTMNAQIKAPFVHLDGRRLFFTAREPDDRELWVLENFLSVPSAAR